jgi:nucleotide-binding universal stress UspA family protein
MRSEPSMTLEHILAAVDFGAASRRALQVAGALGDAFGASVTALHAETFEMPPYFMPDQIHRLERERERLRAAAAEHVRELAAQVTTAPVTPLVAEGAAAEAILSHVGRADLVVMGTHGRRGPGRWWLGSVAERVLRETPVPLLILRAADTSSAPGDLFQHVLVMPGSSGRRSEAAAWAGTLAGRFGGRTAPGPTLASCTPADLSGATLVAAPLEGQGDERLAADAVRLLRACPMPVLFVA